MNNRDSALDKTRELGNAIINSIEFQNLISAEDDYHNDLELISCIEDSNHIKDKDKLEALKKSIDKSLTMKKLNQAKMDYEKLFKNINNLISYITNEESRVHISLPQDKKGCGGGCGGCGAK